MCNVGSLEVTTVCSISVPAEAARLGVPSGTGVAFKDVWPVRVSISSGAPM